MIVSASYKTDIPAFYAHWFANRLQAGFCRMVNPYNRHQHFRVSLLPQDVDGFIFWTKNLGPFLDVLPTVRCRGTPFIVQYTINGYPRALESRVVDASQSVEHARYVAEAFGSRVVVWRYDTIVISSLTPASFHLSNFAALASRLAGATDEVVVSFMQLYKKTRQNLARAAEEHAFAWEDPGLDEKKSLLRELAATASAHGMRLTLCTQPELAIPEVGESRCVDAQRLTDVSGGVLVRARKKGMREGCGCFESRDIGEYDTCPHGCIYCYAVRNRSVALARYQAHDPEGEFLFTPTGAVVASPERKRHALPLFDTNE